MDEEIALIVIGAIILIIVWACVSAEFRRIAAMKGHNEAKYFWWTLFMGPVGMLMVIALPQQAQSSGAEIPALGEYSDTSAPDTSTERFTKLFCLPGNLYAAGSPVIISTGNLLKDTLTGTVLAQLKFQNVDSRDIQALKMALHPFDAFGSSLEKGKDYSYLDLGVEQGDTFGDTISIPLHDPSTRSFRVEVKQVIFSDGSSWTATGAPWEPLPVPETMVHKLRDPELIKQFSIKYGDLPEFMPQRYKDLWLCACGTWNKGPNCHTCHSDKAFSLSWDLDELKAEKDARLAQEKAEQEALEAAERAWREDEDEEDGSPEVDLFSEDEDEEEEVVLDVSRRAIIICSIIALIALSAAVVLMLKTPKCL